jgi:hypothetical protein
MFTADPVPLEALLFVPIELPDDASLSACSFKALICAWTLFCAACKAMEAKPVVRFCEIVANVSATAAP